MYLNIGIFLSSMAISKFIKEMISGFANVIIYASFEELVENYENDNLNILILDRTIGDITAKDVIKKVKNIPHTLLLVSGDYDKNIDGSYSFVLRKPFERDDLKEALSFILRMHKKEIFENKNILIVDDSEVSRNIIKKYVKLFSFNPVDVTNGKEALEYLKVNKDNPPILVLTDQEMPEMDGMTLAKEMRKIELFNDMPIIMISGASDTYSLKEKALSQGINDFIEKPFNEETLKNTLTKYINSTYDDFGECKVLLIDDSFSQRKAISSFLKNKNINVFSTHNIDIVKHLLSDNEFDILLIDYNLGDNFTAKELLKELNLEIDIPVIIYSSFNNKFLKNNLQSFIELGVKDYILTPFEPEEIIFKIKVWKKELELLKDYSKKAELTIYDQLTEAFLRPAFFERAENYFSLARRNDFPLTLLYLDIDHFKRINDTYGHKIGDYVLKEVAKVIKKEKRKEDILGRLGGEEFALLLPYTELNGAVSLAERIREKIKMHNFKEKPEIKITVSIGIGVFNKNIKTFDELLNIADKMLYKAKQTGRDKVMY